MSVFECITQKLNGVLRENSNEIMDGERFVKSDDWDSEKVISELNDVVGVFGRFESDTTDMVNEIESKMAQSGKGFIHIRAVREDRDNVMNHIPESRKEDVIVLSGIEKEYKTTKENISNWVENNKIVCVDINSSPSELIGDVYYAEQLLTEINSVVDENEEEYSVFINKVIQDYRDGMMENLLLNKADSLGLLYVFQTMYLGNEYYNISDNMYDQTESEYNLNSGVYSNVYVPNVDGSDKAYEEKLE
jgi:hypothetical protein